MQPVISLSLLPSHFRALLVFFSPPNLSPTLRHIHTQKKTKNNKKKTKNKKKTTNIAYIYIYIYMCVCVCVCVCICLSQLSFIEQISKPFSSLCVTLVLFPSLSIFLPRSISLAYGVYSLHNLLKYTHAAVQCTLLLSFSLSLFLSFSLTTSVFVLVSICHSSSYTQAIHYVTGQINFVSLSVWF